MNGDWNIIVRNPTWLRTAMKVLNDTIFAMPQPAKLNAMFHNTNSNFHWMPRLADRSAGDQTRWSDLYSLRDNVELYILVPSGLGWLDGLTEPLFDILWSNRKTHGSVKILKMGEICYATSVNGRTDLNLFKPLALFIPKVTPIEFPQYQPTSITFWSYECISCSLLFPFYNWKYRSFYGLHKSRSIMKVWIISVFVLKNKNADSSGWGHLCTSSSCAWSTLFNMFDSFFLRGCYAWFNIQGCC